MLFFHSCNAMEYQNRVSFLFLFLFKCKLYFVVLLEIIRPTFIDVLTHFSCFFLHMYIFPLNNLIDFDFHICHLSEIVPTWARTEYVQRIRLVDDERKIERTEWGWKLFRCRCVICLKYSFCWVVDTPSLMCFMSIYCLIVGRSVQRIFFFFIFTIVFLSLVQCKYDKFSLVSGKWALPATHYGRATDEWFPHFIWVYPGLYQYVWPQDLARRNVPYYQL